MNENKITIHINGCEVTCPAEQEQLYREVLADKWIDGHKVYVEKGRIKTILDPTRDTMSLHTMEALLIEENHKRYALAGRL